MQYRGTRAHHAALADFDAWAHEYVRRDPGVRFDDDGGDDQGHLGVVKIVTAKLVARGAKIGILADGCVGAERNWRHAIAIDIIRQTAVGSHGEIPWSPNFGLRTGVRSRAYGRAETAQQKAAPAVAKLGAETVHRAPYQTPCQPRQLVGK